MTQTQKKYAELTFEPTVDGKVEKVLYTLDDVVAITAATKGHGIVSIEGGITSWPFAEVYEPLEKEMLVLEDGTGVKMADACDIKPFDFVIYRTQDGQYFSDINEALVHGPYVTWYSHTIDRLYYDKEKRAIKYNRVIMMGEGAWYFKFRASVREKLASAGICLCINSKDDEKLWKSEGMGEHTILDVVNKMKEVDEFIAKNEEKIIETVFDRIIDTPHKEEFTIKQKTRVLSATSSDGTQLEEIIGGKTIEAVLRPADSWYQNFIYAAFRKENGENLPELERLHTDGTFSIKLPFESTDIITTKATVKVLCEMLQKADTPLFFSSDIHIEDEEDDLTGSAKIAFYVNSVADGIIKEEVSDEAV